MNDEAVDLDSKREPVRISDTDLRREDFSVCTYNLLHPDYAVKWKLPQGINSLGDSNWPERVHVLGGILRESKMDVCFLQEVGESMMEDLRPYLVEYVQEHAVHPGRRAKDGVAVLVRRQRLQVTGREVIRIAGTGDAPDGNTENNYMSVLAVSALDKVTGARLVLTSVHFYADWFHDPQETVLRYIEGLKHTVDVVVWGGDCNTEYTSPPDGYVGAAETYPTRGPLKKSRTIDWIFASEGAELLRSDATEAFVLSTKQSLEGTGLPPSDHFGEALVVRQLPVSRGAA